MVRLISGSRSGSGWSPGGWDQVTMGQVRCRITESSVGLRRDKEKYHLS
jgi:hypothetical protein